MPYVATMSPVPSVITGNRTGGDEPSSRIAWRSVGRHGDDLDADDGEHVVAARQLPSFARGSPQAV